jgi:hypothetical protein
MSDLSVGCAAADRGRVGEIRGTPHDKRRGMLRNANPSGDFSKAARCGAKTRRGTSCQCPAMKNGRCRLHGGLSTGPKTAEGIERIRLAVTKHGRYSLAAQPDYTSTETLGSVRIGTDGKPFDEGLFVRLSS